VGMSQSSVVHMRKDVGGKIERHRGGRPKLLGDLEKRRRVTLTTEGRLGSASTITKELQSKTCKLFSDIIVRCALREVGLGAQVQQRKPLLSCKHVLACLRFAQRYENWIIND
jgi:hypothetical protein